MTKLFGLVLAGGRSKRMGQDKAAMRIDGKPALARAFDLLEPCCAQRFVAVRPGETDQLRAAFPQISDQFGSRGPADGIASAHAAHPQLAWLVVACDLPLLDPVTLQYLCANHDPRFDATAFRSAHDQLPEPLCAIYQPAGAKKVTAALQADQRCPRKMLLQMNTQLLDQPNPQALDNANTPEQWRQTAQQAAGQADERT